MNKKSIKTVWGYHFDWNKHWHVEFCMMTSGLYYKRVMIVIYNCSRCRLYYQHVMMVTLALGRSLIYDPWGVIYASKGMLQFTARLYNCKGVYSTGHWYTLYIPVLHCPQSGSVINQTLVPVPSISCFIFLNNYFIYPEQNVLAFTQDAYCHLVLCLPLIVSPF